MTEHLKQMQDPEIVKQGQGVPRFMSPFIERDHALFDVDRKTSTSGECMRMCIPSSGGMLTAMSVAWFQTHRLPSPGAVGIFCASVGSFGGDASYVAFPLGEARMPPDPVPAPSQLGCFSNMDQKDPTVSPISSPEILSKFPPNVADHRSS